MTQSNRRAWLYCFGFLLCVLVAIPATAAGPGRAPLSRDAIQTERLQRAIDVKQRFVEYLLTHKGVIGIGVGADADGRPTLRIYTDRTTVSGIPADIEGFPTEVVESGLIEAASTALGPRDRWPRPVPIGVSVAHTDVPAGTIGCEVFRASGCHASYYILSNNHVLANANLGTPGDAILQPGAWDGGVYPDDEIGSLLEYEPIEFSRTARNVMDAAIAWVAPNSTDYRTPSDGYGAPRNSQATAYPGMAVKKYGRTSRLTRGVVDSINATIIITYGAQEARFVNQLIIVPVAGQTSFSSPGDSGSLIVVDGGSDDRKVVGLLFAAGTGMTAANPIGPIIQRFGVNISGDL